jgi:hypothetical protein
VSVRQGELFVSELVLDQERALAYPPQRHPPGKLAQKGLLRAGQAEQVAGALGLGRGLTEKDAGLGVGQ